MHPRFLISFVAFAVSAHCIALAQPAVIAGRITGVVDVTKPAASPTLSLTIEGGAQSVIAQYQSPSGVVESEAFSAATTQYTGIPLSFTGQVTLRGYAAPGGGNGGVLPIYAEPGVWTFTDLAVCDNQGCSQYSGANLAKIFKKKLSFTVVNRVAPDVTPPSAAWATIATPSVSISSGAIPRITVSASDAASGLYAITATANLATPTFPITFSNQIPPQPIMSGVFTLVAPLPANQTPGNYTIDSVTLTDIAGNTATISDPAALASLFGGKTSFAVSP